MKKIYVILFVIAIAIVLVLSLPQTSDAPTKTSTSTPTTAIATTTQQVAIPVAGDVMLGVGETGQVGKLSIVWNGPVQDSRCPKSVQCIWAGEVKVAVTLSLPTNSKTVSMTSGTTAYTFEGYKVSIPSVTPYPAAPGKIALEKYQVIFHVEPI